MKKRSQLSWQYFKILIVSLKMMKINSRLVSEPNISYNPSGPNQDSSKFETSIVIGRVDPAAWLATVNDTIKYGINLTLKF